MTFAFDLRDYQAEAIAGVADLAAAGSRRILLVMPTGAGKTIVSAYLMSKYSQMGLSCGFMVERRNLVEQASDRLRSAGVPHGIFMAGYEHYAHEPVQIVSRDTLYERCFRTKRLYPPAFDVLFRDECHMGLAPTDLEIYDHYSDAVLVGITATPARADGAGMGFLFTSLVQPRTFQQLISAGHLLPNKIYQPRKFDDSVLKIRAGEYRLDEAADSEVRKQAPIGSVVADWRRLGEDRATIAFCPTIKGANWLADEFRVRGVTAEPITMHTSQEDRALIYDASRSGHVKVITSVEVLSRGADLPWVGCCIHLRPMRNVVPWIQSAGRANRPWPGQDSAIQIDHVGNTARLGYPEDYGRWGLGDGSLPLASVDRECSDSVPAVCGECGAAKPEPGPCQSCGYVPVVRPVSEKIEFEPGSLVLAKRKKAASPVTDEQRTWNKCLGIAIHRGLSVGVAGSMFKRYTGQFPRNLERIPTDSSQWKMDARRFYDTYHKKRG